MTTDSPDPAGRLAALASTRRLFLIACAGLFVPSISCTSLGSRVRAGYAFGNDPSLAEYRDILRALVRTVLPCEDAAFPAGDDVVVSRLLDLFELETDERLLTVQQTLIFFDDVTLFAEPAAFLDAERVAMDAGTGARDELDRRRVLDVQLYGGFAASNETRARRFVRLSLADQRRYFTLWGASAFVVKRRFFAAAKALIMISAYSMDSVWASIGYDGPILRR